MSETRKENENYEDNLVLGFATTIKRARRRLQRGDLPVTPEDEHWTAIMISLPTSYLDRDTRLNILMSVFASGLTWVEPASILEELLDDIQFRLREYVDTALEKGVCRLCPKKIDIKVEKRVNAGHYVFDPYDFALADEAFLRAIRRYNGEDLVVTEEDQLGTLALIEQLMAGNLGYDTLVKITANAIVEEYNGPPPGHFFRDFKNQVRRTIDLMRSNLDGPLN